MPTTHANSRELLVVPFAAVGIGAIAEVGGKNASLGEMIRELAGHRQSRP